MLMPARTAATLIKIGGVHRHVAAGRLEQTCRADYWGARYSQNYPHPRNSLKTHMPRASIFIDPTIILLGLCRPRHHPYGRDDNTSCETLWKSRRKTFYEQFSARLVRPGIVGIIQCPVPVRPSRISNATWRANRLMKLVVLTPGIGITSQFPFPDPNPFGDIPTSIHRRRPTIWTPEGVILCITGMGISL